MLNRVIRLQAVLKIITNRTAEALGLLAKQQTQMRAAIYQNGLALDYLLAEEGGVCGKFNLSNCCLNIDNNGEAVMEISEGIRKIAHVPVQKWKSFGVGGWWPSVFDGTWWKTMGFILRCALAGLLFLPCLIPCFQRLIMSVVGRMQVVTVPVGRTGQTEGTPGLQKIMILKPGEVQQAQREEIKLMLSKLETKYTK
ncbi:hypothetical protein scyTo_0026952 [Scyliorhinus torazame]|uniref:ENR1 protein n=1 Tax=Scyliorhinus torazame TaxID=75743 RepID=A0A401QLE7_SCYTO|nr:hypothetical protein [Scyliorhinus torazame]